MIYIGGYSRSGSTLMLRLMGELPGVVAVGELFDIWHRSYGENQLCGCGVAFADCPFWREVTLRAYSRRPSELPVCEWEELRRRVQGYGALPRLLWAPLRSRRYRMELKRYAGILEQLYHGISDVSQARYIVDSSKVPQFAWLVGEIPGVQLHLVHLVRDSRATAFSWRREKIRPEITGKVQLMERHTVVRSSIEWNIFNLLLRQHKDAVASYTLVRYEDFVADTQAALESIGSAVGAKWDVGWSGTGALPSVKVAHTASGNPIRFEVGNLSVRRDDEWVTRMSRMHRLVATTLTAPGLRRYGYDLRGTGVASRTER